MSQTIGYFSRYFTSLVIYQAVLSNVIGIFGKAANKLRIYLLLNETPEISPAFLRLELNFLLRAADNSSNLNQSGATSKSVRRDLILLLIISIDGNKITYNSERISLVLGNFHVVRIARNRNFRSTRE